METDMDIFGTFDIALAIVLVVLGLYRFHRLRQLGPMVQEKFLIMETEDGNVQFEYGSEPLRNSYPLSILSFRKYDAQFLVAPKHDDMPRIKRVKVGFRTVPAVEFLHERDPEVSMLIAKEKLKRDGAAARAEHGSREQKEEQA